MYLKTLVARACGIVDNTDVCFDVDMIHFVRFIVLKEHHYWISKTWSIHSI